VLLYCTLLNIMKYPLKITNFLPTFIWHHIEANPSHNFVKTFVVKIRMARLPGAF